MVIDFSQIHFYKINRSEDNIILYNDLLVNGYSSSICNKPYIYELYKSIKFPKNKITQMDKDLLNFINLDSLILDENFVRKIENIPASLTKLHLYNNFVESIIPSISQNNLLFLGIFYEKLKSLNNF